MANDFEQFPIYDDLVKNNTNKMSDIWTDFMAFFYQNLASYISSHGFFLPNLTTTQRNDIVSPVNGQMIYNTSLNTAQYFKAGIWTSF